MASVERVIKCRYCSTWSLVDVPGLVPEYYVKPRLKEIDARRKLQKLLTDPDMPDGLLKQAGFHSARLFFIPFHEMNGRRLGTMTITKFQKTKPRQLKLMANVGPHGMRTMSLRDGRIMTPKKKTVDTRVIMGDVERLEPAVRLDEWALCEAEIKKLRSDPAGTLHSMNRRAMETIGKVYDPTISADNLIAQLEMKAGTAWLDDNTRIAEVRVKRIFYPVWRARYQYQGRLYGATVDGVTGKMMSARAPQDDRSRVLWLLGSTALVAFFGGKILKGVVSTLWISPKSWEAMIELAVRLPLPFALVLLVGLLIVVAVLGLGWEQFRYPGEIVIRGDERKVEKINRPDRTLFDVAREALEDILGAILKSGSSRRGRGFWS